MMSVMDQIVVRKLESDIKPKLQARAAKRGLSLEAHIRQLLRADADKPEEMHEGFGTKMARLFEDCGLAPGQELERPTFLPWTPVKFDE